jgi:hypothetical protein
MPTQILLNDYQPEQYEVLVQSHSRSDAGEEVVIIQKHAPAPSTIFLPSEDGSFRGKILIWDDL